MTKTRPHPSNKGVNQPRLQFVCDHVPDQNGTGLEKRSFSFLCAYAKFATVDLLVLQFLARADQSRLSSAKKICRRVTARPKLFVKMALKIPFSGIRRRLALVDAVHLVKLADFVDNFQHDQLFWDIDEVPPRFKENWNSQKLHVPNPEAKQRYLEKLNSCDLVFASSDVEKRLSSEKVQVVPNVISDPGTPQAPHQSGPPNLLFVGALGQFPNLEGLTYFAQNVLPILKTMVPNVTVTVVGRMQDNPELRAKVSILQKISGLQFHTNVPDCGPYYAAASVAIAPTRIGGGTRVKIIEAFAYGCPVVSTPKGCEGLNVIDGCHLLVKGTDQEFAQACADLIANPALGKHLTEQARDFFQKYHTQEIVNDSLLRLVTPLI
jgi:glycosyltransferase involved in cell wall biosynthesis